MVSLNEWKRRGYKGLLLKVFLSSVPIVDSTLWDRKVPVKTLWMLHWGSFKVNVLISNFLYSHLSPNQSVKELMTVDLSLHECTEEKKNTMLIKIYDQHHGSVSRLIWVAAVWPQPHMLELFLQKANSANSLMFSEQQRTNIFWMTSNLDIARAKIPRMSKTQTSSVIPKEVETVSLAQIQREHRPSQCLELLVDTDIQYYG